jgi:hypothetical protein
VPESLTWCTNELEARIAESQKMLYPGWPRVNLDIGVFRALTLAPAAFKAAKNPNGATLEDVLTPDAYAIWIRLRKEYLDDDDDIDRYRPMIAEERLTNAIGRSYRPRFSVASVDSVVYKLAKKHKVKVHTLPAVERKIEVESPRAILKAAREVDFAEGACFGRNLARLERWIGERDWLDAAEAALATKSRADAVGSGEAVDRKLYRGSPPGQSGNERTVGKQ